MITKFAEKSKPFFEKFFIFQIYVAIRRFWGYNGIKREDVKHNDGYALCSAEALGGGISS